MRLDREIERMKLVACSLEIGGNMVLNFSGQLEQIAAVDRARFPRRVRCRGRRRAWEGMFGSGPGVLAAASPRSGAMSESCRVHDVLAADAASGDEGASSLLSRRVFVR